MIRFGQRKAIWTALLIGIFCFFTVNNAMLSEHVVTSTDCPMKVECKVCTVSVSENLPNFDMVFPVSCDVFIPVRKLASLPADPALPPPRA